MKCIVKKLRESVNNPSLPVLERLQILSYVTTTQDGQYVFLGYYDTPENQSKVDVDFELASNNSVESTIISIGSNSYISTKSGYIMPFNTHRLDYYSSKVGTVQNAGLDLSNGFCYVDENSGTCTSINQNTWGCNLYLFAKHNVHNSIAGVIKIRKAIFTLNDGEHIILPCKKGNIFGFIDTKTNKFYTEANGGALIGE